MRTPLFLLAMMLWGMELKAQFVLVEKLRLNDASSSKGITLSKPTLASGQQLVFPVTAGAVNQVLAISSVTSSTVNMGWVTASAGSSSSSKRIKADQTATYGTTATGIVQSASANKNYRVTGVIRTNRVTSAGSPSDKFKLTLSGPAGSSYISLAFRCYDCPGNTSGVPGFPTPSSTSVTSDFIDPAGTGSLDYSTCTIGIDGLVKVGSSSGDVTIVAVDGAAGDNSTIIRKDSYILLTEIE